LIASAKVVGCPARSRPGVISQSVRLARSSGAAGASGTSATTPSGFSALDTGVSARLRTRMPQTNTFAPPIAATHRQEPLGDDSGHETERADLVVVIARSLRQPRQCNRTVVAT
jgi:hypothetical protein